MLLTAPDRETGASGYAPGSSTRPSAILSHLTHRGSPWPTNQTFSAPDTGIPQGLWERCHLFWQLLAVNSAPGFMSSTSRSWTQMLIFNAVTANQLAGSPYSCVARNLPVLGKISS